MKTQFIIVSLLIPLIGLTINFLKPDLKDQFLDTIFLLVEVLFKENQIISKAKCLDEGHLLFTPQQLSQFNGSPGSKAIYLAFLGIVYDVSKGFRHYQPGGAYAFFAGKDASRAFVTGQFDQHGLVDDVQDLPIDNFADVKQWMEFYDSEYSKVGKLIGTYYDLEGCPTKAVSNVRNKIEEYEMNQEANLKEYEIFPHCNSEQHAETNYHRVWCTDMSGGVKRQWVGVPRQLYLPREKTYRCACVRNYGPPTAPAIEYADENDDNGSQALKAEGNIPENVGDLLNPRIKEYSGCDPKASECVLNN